MIFELPEGLELGEEITKTNPETSSHLTILVCNNTDRNILLKRRTELGRVHMVKSVLPIPNPPEQKCTQGEEKPYSGVTSHQGDEQDEWEPLVDLGQQEENERTSVKCYDKKLVPLQETMMMLAVLRIWSLKFS